MIYKIIYHSVIRKLEKLLTSFGIMSGTSMDGIDFSLIKSDGKKKIFSKYNITYQYPQELKNDIKKLIIFLNGENVDKTLESQEYKLTEKKFEDFLKKKISLFIKSFGIPYDTIQIFGFHGQTLIHKPKKKISIQLGNAKTLSNYFNIPFVSNFRQADIDCGGQGAPLVPVFHKAIFFDKKYNLAVVNLGGISNVTWIFKNGEIYASDIGPGNVLIDSYCKSNLSMPYDKNGQLAAQGKVHDELIDKWLKFPFVNNSIPKSFDNFEFKLDDFIKKKSNFDNFDILATLTNYTARIVVHSQFLINKEINRWIICGGGSKNITLVKNIKRLTKNVFTSDEFGWNADFVESQAFAYLAIRKLKKLKSSFKETTGTKKPVECGNIFYPNGNIL